MTEQHWLAGEFAAQRPRLRAVAYRMLGSRTDADDAVQEAWLRLSRTDAGSIDNLGGWLTTVVARVCLNMLRARTSRREEPLELERGTVLLPADDAAGEHEAMLADSVGLALLVVLETLTPAERVAFVLHDMFDLPFDEIATVVGRTPAAARQLASRARRRVRGASPAQAAGKQRRREVVAAFLAASRGGDFAALLALLDPDVVLRADETAVRTGATAEIRGAANVAQMFAGRASAARLALIDGAVGAVWAPGGRPRVVFRFNIADGHIDGIELIADRDRLAELAITLLDTGAES